MSGLILPGDRPARGGLTLLVPRGYESEAGPEPIGVCRVATGPGETCGMLFFAGEERALEQHVGRCAREHIDAVVAESPRARNPLMDDANWDPEIARHMKDLGSRMRREGRLVVHKNERAGF